MLIYNSVEEINREEGIQATGRGEPAPKDWGEADWGYRLRGFGQPGGEEGGWLLCFLFRGAPFSPNEARTGTLIAYEINGDRRTGRVGVLRRDWTGALDDKWHSHVLRSPEWASREAPGEDSLERIDALLPGERL